MCRPLRARVVRDEILTLESWKRRGTTWRKFIMKRGLWLEYFRFFNSLSIFGTVCDTLCINFLIVYFSLHLFSHEFRNFWSGHYYFQSLPSFHLLCVTPVSVVVTFIDQYPYEDCLTGGLQSCSSLRHWILASLRSISHIKSRLQYP